jgi:hypothetical protein
MLFDDSDWHQLKYLIHNYYWTCDFFLWQFFDIDIYFISNTIQKLSKIGEKGDLKLIQVS